MHTHQKSTPVTENPCAMCMPMGGILAFKGLEQSMVLIHGSQGCSTYMRRHIAEHFNEPVDVASSSLNEKGTIYGGEKNLQQGLTNVLKVYQPKLIGVLTTCLAETIGEDIERITANYLSANDLTDFPIVNVATPGYGHSHSEGYWLAVRQIVATLSAPCAKHNRINVIVPNISPADIREIKRILNIMSVDYTLLPDISDTLDRPFSRPYTKLPSGGTPIAEIRQAAGARATIQFGSTIDEELSPGHYLAKEFDVPLYNLPLPIGIENTDRFIELLSELGGQPVPQDLKVERGRLLDSMIDSHKYNFQGRSVIFGEPELVYALSMTCLENGVYPVVIATGSSSKKLPDLLGSRLSIFQQTAPVQTSADLGQVLAHSQEANIALGPSTGKILTEKAGIPLVRTGFPIHDRVGGQRILSVGYKGTTELLDRITNTLLEAKLGNYRQNMYSQFYRKAKLELHQSIES